MTLPVAMSSAANSEVVPWRVSSRLRRAGWPGRMGSMGCLGSDIIISMLGDARGNVPGGYCCDQSH
jgi:hypothetical protein